MTFPPITTHDGRRAYAFAGIMGGCGVMTMFAATGVYLVSGNELYSLILGLAAHVQIFVGLSALAFLLGRRVNLDISRDGVKLDDTGGEPPSQSVKVEVTQ